MKESDRRLTPPWLLDVVRVFAPIALDPCTEPHNPTGALEWMAIDENCDGLASRWSTKLDGAPFGAEGLCYVNPPFSRGQVSLWAGKCLHEAVAYGREIILLTKDDCRTTWNRYLTDNADVRCRVHRGAGFLEPAADGTWKQLVGPSWGTALWYWGRRRRRFARVFGAIGEVTQLLGPQE